MASTTAGSTGKPIWIDLASSDPAGSRQFYAEVFGWDVEVTADPQYGGYALARVGGKDVAGIGPKMMAEAPSDWSVCIGTDDAEALTAKAAAGGGTVIAAPMQVGDTGRLAVFQDPAGAFIGAWQPQTMSGFAPAVVGGFAWAELNARGLDRALPFYAAAFGWTARSIPMGEGQPVYTELLLGDERVAGALEMSPMVPAEVPSYWMVYFAVADADAVYAKAIAAGAREMLAPQGFPGGRFAILADPQGAVFAVRSASA